MTIALAARSIPELQEERALIWQRMNDIRDAAVAAGRAMDATEEAQYEALGQQIDGFARQIEQEQEHRRRSTEIGEVRRDNRALPTDVDSDAAERSTRYRSIFNTYLRQGLGAIAPEERQILQRGYVANGNGEQRALATAPATAGGFVIPQGFSGRITETMKWFGGMRQVSQIMPTETGQEIPFPTNDDTANKGRRVADNVAATSTDLTFGQRMLHAYLYSSDIILVPLTLLMDEAVDLEGYIARMAANRIGRIENYEQTVGTGSAQPNGIVTAATSGKTTASATAITYGELVDLEHSVDPAYRNAAQMNQAVNEQANPEFVGYMFNDLILAYLRKLVDGNSRPLWIPQLGAGLVGGVPATFNGWKYTINNDMASTVAANNITAAFGAFHDGYLIREVQGVTMLRLDERYADAFQVAFLAFHRMDSSLIDAAAIKVLTQHS